MKNLISTLFFVASLSTCVAQETSVRTFKMINPVFLSSEFMGDEKEINIEDRSKEFFKLFTQESDYVSVDENNLTSMKYKPIEGGEDTIRATGYQYLGSYGDYDVLFCSEYGNDHVMFTEISLFKINAKTIQKSEIIAAGHGSHGAILPHAILVGDIVYYYQHLSNAMLLKLAGYKEALPKSEENAANQFSAIGKFSYNITTKKSELLGINLIAYNGKPTKCSAVVASSVQNGDSFLNTNQSRTFLKKLKEDFEKK